MKFNDIIAYTAIAIGIVKMYIDFENSNNIDIKLKNSVIFGIIVTTTWLIYYTNQNDFSVFTMYTVLSLLLQLHVLRNIMFKENNLK
jgi:CDP-diglyceride synthetase